MSEKLRIGCALCGSFCTFEKTMAVLEDLAGRYDLTAVVSQNAGSMDTRFGTAADHRKRLEEKIGRASCRERV